MVDAQTHKMTDEELINSYSRFFDRNAAGRLLVKLRKATRYKSKIIAGPAGALVSALGSLIAALDNPNCPTHMKATIIGAIGYIILPLDLIPDVMPGIGYTNWIGGKKKKN